MLFKEVYDKFVEKAPVPVMARAALENCFGAAELDRIFAEHAARQREQELLFSSVVDLLQLTVLKGRPSVNAAYQQKKEALGVAVKSVYDKLARVEPEVSRAMVRETARSMSSIVEEMDGQAETQSGYRTKIVDGKHLDRTERRLKPLREINGAPLPGQVMAVLDADTRLVADVFPCEDGHAQERTLLSEVLQSVQAGDLWIADRAFCTIGFLYGIDSRQACFVVRLHGNMRPQAEGPRKRVKRGKTGVVYEQAVSINTSAGPLKLRQVEVELDKPTRDGNHTLTILTNLPKRVSATRVAELYRDRWTIEQAFQEIAQALHAEIKTLAYPKAALLGFCLALVAFNLLSLIKTAIATAQEGTAEELSSYYLADEIAAGYYGMQILLTPDFWREEFHDLTPKQMSRRLLRLARDIRWERYRKSATRAKGPPKDVGPKATRPHVSTKRILDNYHVR
jgi:hypothetical protein